MALQLNSEQSAALTAIKVFLQLAGRLVHQ